MSELQSLTSHLSLGTNRFEEAVAFYDAVLQPLGCARILEHPGTVAWGRAFPEFWITRPLNGEPASVGNGTHIAFQAADRESVQAFWDAALAAGAQPDGAPGPREEYGKPYFGCFVRDLDGHKIEATFWDQSLI